jgi:hypothetical protein
VLALDHGVPARGADRARAGARACLLLPRPGAESPWSLEDLRAAAAQLAPGGQLVVSLPTDLPPERFLEALATAGGALPASSAWFLDGEILLLCGTEVVRPQLEDLEASLATLAHFVAELGPGSAPPRSRLQVAGGSRPSEDEAQRLRRRARNLEQLFARTSSLPTAWSPLLAVSDGPLAGTPELRAGRHLREAYLAHAWLGHHAAAAPDSLALETWAARLDRALQAALASLPGHAETLDLAELAQAEAGVRRGFELLESGEAMGAIPFLVRATQRWPERGDLALGLATALELAGNTSAAQVVLRDLGAQRASLFQTEVGRRLTGLGLTPPR